MVGTLQSVQAINHRTAIMWFSEMVDTEKHQLLLHYGRVHTAVYIVTTGGNTSIQLMIVHYHMFTITTIYGYIKAIIHDYLCKHCLLATNYFLSITLSVLAHNVPAEVDLARPVYSAHLLLLLMVAHDCHWCCQSV